MNFVLRKCIIISANKLSKSRISPLKSSKPIKGLDKANSSNLFPDSLLRQIWN